MVKFIGNFPPPRQKRSWEMFEFRRRPKYKLFAYLRKSMKHKQLHIALSTTQSYCTYDINDVVDLPKNWESMTDEEQHEYAKMQLLNLIDVDWYVS